jgi:hypothetical protein
LKWLAVAVSVRARSPAHNPAQVEDDVLDDAGGVVLVTVWRDEPASPAPGFLSINLVLPVIRQDVAGLAEPQVLALRAVAGQASGVELPEQNVAHKQASVLDGGVKEIAAVDQAEEVAVSGADGAIESTAADPEQGRETSGCPATEDKSRTARTALGGDGLGNDPRCRRSEGFSGGRSFFVKRFVCLSFVKRFARLRRLFKITTQDCSAVC